MAEHDEFSIRDELLDVLLAKVESDTYPSTEMLDEIEALLTPEELPAYAEKLLARVRATEYPSWPMIRRLHNLAGRQMYVRAMEAHG